MDKLLEALQQRILIIDGAMGTMIQRYKLDEGGYRGSPFRNHPRDLKGANDLLSLTQPQIIEEIHRAYLAAGADIIDVGGESTRPNSTPVAADEELHRVLPVIEAITARTPVPVSIDTRKAGVAAAALDAGASIVNDIWGLRGDPAMAAVVAGHPDCAVVVMHNQNGVEYDNLLGVVCGALRESLAIAWEAGIAAERVIVDPDYRRRVLARLRAESGTCAPPLAAVPPAEG